MLMDISTRILTHLCEHLEQTGTSITTLELATHLGCSPATAHHLIHQLTNRGLLTRAGPEKTLLPTEQGLLHIARI